MKCFSQKAVIGELEVQLSEERNLRREERDKAAEDLKSVMHKMQAEAQEEIKRQAELYLRQQREQKEVISKLQVLFISNYSLIYRFSNSTSIIAITFHFCLQESEKESRLLVETLRSKLVCFKCLVKHFSFLWGMLIICFMIF